jgi:hypothetical protein
MLPYEVCLILRILLQRVVESYDIGPMGLLPLGMKECCGFLSSLKIHRYLERFEPANLVSNGKHANH